jgi:hypothetical protein
MKENEDRENSKKKRSENGDIDEEVVIKEEGRERRNLKKGHRDKGEIEQGSRVREKEVKD